MALNQILFKLKLKKMVINLNILSNLYHSYFCTLLAPDSSPLNLNVELESINSLSIKWESPPMNKTNGIILGYKVKFLF